MSRRDWSTLMQNDEQETEPMMSKLFLEHPRKVEESYLEHAGFAGRFALRLFAAGFAALIHAILPCLFEKTASRMIARMHAQTKNRAR